MELIGAVLECLSQLVTHCVPDSISPKTILRLVLWGSVVVLLVYIIW